MGYVLTEEQQFLQDSAKDLLKKAPVSLVRELRDKNDDLGFSLDLWNQMIEMGWPGMAVSEDLGGLSFGLRAMGILMEELGRSLSASPLLSVATSAMIKSQDWLRSVKRGVLSRWLFKKDNFINRKILNFLHPEMMMA